MLKLYEVFFFVCCIVFTGMGSAEISLSGTVKDGKGASIAGAMVSLASDSLLADTTEADGIFTLSNITATSNNPAYGISVHRTGTIAIKGNELRFSIVSPAENGDISLFSSDGKRCFNLPLAGMKAGEQRQILPDLAPGYYILTIKIDKSTTSCKLVHSGTGIIVSGDLSGVKSTAGISRSGSAGGVNDTLIVKKEGFPTVKKAITAYKQTDIALVLDQQPVYAYGATVENTCTDCQVPELKDASQLTKNTKFPDPFVKIDGTKIGKKSEWRCRRQEILAQAMKYIYGEKPPPPEVVTGTVTNTKISVHVEDKGKQIDFSSEIVLPTKGTAPFPAIINMGAKNNFMGMTLGESRVLGEGVAVIYYNYTVVGTEGQDGHVDRSKDFNGLFYTLYGGKHSAGVLMAVAWGASRMIDVLQQSGGQIIDYRRLGVTGCSRGGKFAFAIGLFDERVALTLPEESSLGGLVAYRVADAKCTEKTQSNFNDQLWFSNNFKPFVMNTSLLPIDAHELVATMAPRGYYGMENSSANSMAQQMCPQGGNMSVQGAAEVYKALGCSQNLSYNSTPTNINHCSYSEIYTKSLTENIKKFLFHQPGETGKIEAGTTENRDSWIDWTAPPLEDDTNIYKTE